MDTKIGLESCPNEIIAAIVDHVLPEDLEAFAQTSRRIRSSSLSLLSDHRARIQKYSTIVLYNGYPGLVETFLRQLLLEPMTARYVTRLKVDPTHPPVEDFRGMLLDCLKQYDADFYLAAVEDSQFLTSTPIESSTSNFYREDTHDWMRVCRPNMILALLLPLLPNLTTLEIGCAINTSSDHWISTMLEAIPRAKTQALGKLKSVYLFGNLASKFSLDHAIFLSALPSVRFVAIPRTSPPSDKMKDGRVVYPKSHLTDLELYQSTARPSEIHDLVQSCEGLRSLTYTYDGHPDSTDTFDASIIRNALLARASCTLEKLVISAPEQNSCYMGPLKEFEALKVIWIDWNLIFSDEGAGVTLQRLSDQLPRSLRALTVYDQTGHNRMKYRSLTESFVLAKLSHLPQLTDVIYRKSATRIALADEFWQGLQQKCAFVEIRLSVQELEARHFPEIEHNEVTEIFAPSAAL